MSTKQNTTTRKKNTASNRSNSKSKRSSATDKQPAQQAPGYAPELQALLDNARPATIPESAIVLSPFNYRKQFSTDGFKELTESIKLHGIISPLLVRPLGNDRYELVVGERRLCAARFAGYSEVPVRIAELTDEQVIVIQLIENMQREDPHPLHEAKGIARLLDKGHTIEAVAARLGRSKSFIYQRLKLSTLITPFCDMFLADVINLTQAIALAALDPQSQQAFYDEYCTDWSDTTDFEIYDLSGKLNRYQRDLTEAPFDPTDATLLPEAGACTHCPDNSATLTSLFPELAQNAVCSNHHCYNRKCDAFMSLRLLTITAEHQPTAILFDIYVDRRSIEKLDSLAPLQPLTRYQYYDYDQIDVPTMPDREDYTYADEQEPFDEEGYQQAMDEYNSELEEFNQLLQAGKLQKGLLLEESNCEVVYFMPSQAATNSRQYSSTKTTTAKEVQQAIKEGTATPELLQGEINRINQREERAQVIDNEKMQEDLHQQFEAGLTDTYYNELTTADHTAARYLIYRSLSLSNRMALHQTFYGEKYHYGEPDDICQKLAALDDRGFAFLIRRALLDEDGSKRPASNPAKLLLDAAAHAGVDVAAIRQDWQDKANIRQQRIQERIQTLEKKIRQLQEQVAIPSAT